LKTIFRFPLTKFITDGDEYFKRLWSMIDNCRDYFWITTYAMDSSPAADTTLYKLTDAAARGVHVVLFIDNVQLWVKSELIE
jgi:phosphatidylserine/phosphatidylglycerophosphate/cardiolipin synthase-like enzyme